MTLRAAQSYASTNLGHSASLGVFFERSSLIAVNSAGPSSRRCFLADWSLQLAERSAFLSKSRARQMKSALSFAAHSANFSIIVRHLQAPSVDAHVRKRNSATAA